MDSIQLFSEYLMIRLLINTTTMVVMIQLIYYSVYEKKDFYFTFYLFNFIVFLLTFLLEKTKAFSSFGSAFGLLAAFSLLRLRTEPMSIKDMTYIFIIMTIGLINAVMKGTYLDIIFVNLFILIAVFVVDGNRIIKNQKSKVIEYDSLQNIRPDERNLLIDDLKKRTGLDIRKVHIEQLDLVKNRAVIRVYYY